MIRVPRHHRVQRRACPGRRRSTRGRELGALALCALLAFASACAARQQRSGYGRTLYAWTDRSGNVRYTTYPERVPAVRLRTLRKVVPGRSAEASAALLPGARTEATARNGQDAGQEVGPTAAADAAHLKDLDTRIAELEETIRRDQEILKLLISDPKAAPTLHSSEELAAIAKRLPERQAALQALREERARRTAPDAP
jgi:hypothetical protein